MSFANFLDNHDGWTDGYQIVEAIELHQEASGEEARDRAVEALASVSISDPARCD